LTTQRRVDIRYFARLLKHTEAPFSGKPFIPAPWQDEYLDKLFNTKRPDGLRQYQRSLLAIPRKNGKALALDTPVLTAAGWKTMGTVDVGDEVFHPSGYRTRVVAVSEVMHGRPCYAMSFTRGETIVADAEHLWKTTSAVGKPLSGQRRGLKRGDCGGEAIRRTAEIASTVWSNSRRQSNHRIPVCSAIEMPAASLPVDPYVFGLWLGDGSKTQAAMAVGGGDEETIENIRDSGYQTRVKPRLINGRTHYTVSIAGVDTPDGERVLNHLRSMGVFANKHIPRIYVESSVNQRLSLLQGLMDSDGYCSKDGLCVFVNNNKAIVDGIAEVVRSLGMKAVVKTKPSRSGGKDYGLMYNVVFTPWLPTQVFRLSRKQNNVRCLPKKTTKTRFHYIQSCEPADSVPVRCIQVEAADGMFLVGRSLIPTHNSSMCAVVGAYEGFFGAEGGQILIAAGDRKQASLLFTACSRYIESCPGLLKRAKIYKGSIVIPHKNSVIQFLSSEHRGKHGFNPSVVILDELHVQPNRDLLDVLESGMGARTEPLVIYVTTAGMDRIGPCYDEWQRALKVRDGLIEDPTFLPCIYEADDGDDFSDEAVWAKANPNYGVTVRKEFMEREAALARESVAQEIKFRTLYLNQWVSNGANRFFRSGVIDKCMVPTRPIGDRIAYCGLDLSSNTDTTAFVAVWPDEDGSFDVHCHIFIPEENATKDEAPYKQWAKDGLCTLTEGDLVDFDAVRNYVLSFCEKNAVRAVSIDRWNATHITTQLVAEGIEVKPYGQGYASMSAPTKLLEALVLGGRLRLGDNKAIALHLSNMQVRVDDAGNIKPTKQHSHSTARIDAAVALVMSLGLASSEAHGPAEEPTLIVF